jgi:predicted DNA-binding protein
MNRQNDAIRLTNEINECKKVISHPMYTNIEKQKAKAVAYACRNLLSQLINEMTDQGYVQNISIKA